jgi:translation initiation factor 3 subunit D
MATDSLDYVRIIESCPAGDGWGPPVTTETTLDGVPYAPFSKGDKLGRMADWTAEGKDRERGGRTQFNRNFRGEFSPAVLLLSRLYLLTWDLLP